MKQSNRVLLVVFATVGALFTAACLDNQRNDDSVGSGKVSAADYAPKQDIPGMHPLLNWAGLRLGMSNFDISQVYNAPEGYGDGFTRVLEHYGSSTNQIISFEHAEGEPQRTITCALYRDKLFLIVDRREGLSGEHVAGWFTECQELFGAEFEETVAGAQWSWGGKDSILATFTQDNASENYMNANLVIEHRPTKDAWHSYNAAWEEAQKAQ